MRNIHLVRDGRTSRNEIPEPVSGTRTSGSIRDNDSQVPGGGGTVGVVIGGVAGAIAVVVGTVDKLTTVGATSYGSLGGSPATRAFCPGVG